MTERLLTVEHDNVLTEGIAKADGWPKIYHTDINNVLHYSLSFKRLGLLLKY